MFPGDISPRILDLVLKETSELICSQIDHVILAIHLGDASGEVVATDTIMKVHSGKQIARAIYVPRQYRKGQVLEAVVHYYDALAQELMCQRFGRVKNGDLITFTVPRPEDFHY
jgi:hypothetical protein